MEKIKDRPGEALKMSRVLHVKWVLPDDFFDDELTEDAFTQELKEDGVLKLFQKGRISSGYGAKMLGITRREFLELLHAKKIPFIDMTDEELKEEIQTAHKLASLIPNQEK